MKLRAHHGLFLGFVAVVGVLVAAAAVMIETGLRRQLVEVHQRDLARDLALARLLIEGSGGSFSNLPELAERMRESAGYRVTLVARDGTVLADSDSDHRAMENHGDRPEVRGALSGATTFAERRSATVGNVMLYGATLLAFEGEPVVLRLAASLEVIDATVGQTQGAVAGAGIVAIILALGLSYVLARALAHPLENVATRARRIAAGAVGMRPLPSSRMAELADLVEAFNRLTADLDGRISEIRRLEEVRSDFVANASHELKTPLTAVRGFSETLLEDDPPEELRQDFLDLIWRNTVRLQQLVEDLLDLSRLESGGWVSQPEHLRVEELALKAWTQAGPRVSESGARLYIDGGGTALADARGLLQIFRNLFDNALRHTPGGGSIRVGVERGEGEEDRIEVSVGDTGSGIPLVHLPRIFERFYRVDPARSRAEGGTGLGLAIVRHLVMAMGGEVWAESVIDEGTTIRFTLPRGSSSLASRMRMLDEDDDEAEDEEAVSAAASAP